MTLALACGCACALAMALAAHAQDVSVTRGPGLDPLLHDSFYWVRFGEEDGLPDEHVSRVLEASDGTVWALTGKGLAWYDGYGWRAADGAPRTGIHDLASDADGNLVILCGDEAYFGGRAGFARVPLGTEKALACESTPSGEVVALVDRPDQENAFLVIGATRGTAHPALPGKLYHARRTFRASCGGDGLWMTDASHLYRWSRDEWKPEREIPTGYVTSMISMRDAEGRGLVYFMYPLVERGLWEWTEPDTLVRLFRMPNQLPVTMDVTPEGDAVIVLATSEVLVRQEGVWTTLAPLPDAMRRINSATFRRDGGLWAATDQGLFLYRPRHPRLSSWKHGVGRLWSTRALEYLRTSDGSVWVGTSAGLERRPERGPVERIDSIGDTPLLTITGLCEDSAGNVWISSGDGSFPGAFRWDGSSWRHLGPDEGLDCPAVHKIRLDRRGRLWFLGIAIGALDGDNPGAFVYDGARFERWNVERGLLSDRVYDFAEAEDGALWFGTHGGLSRWRAGTWTHWTAAGGLLDNRVSTLALDEGGRVWFGHQTKPGLGIVAGDRVRYESMTSEGSGLQVHKIALDASGTPWAATTEGLWTRIDGHDVLFTADDGLGSDRIGMVQPFEDRVLAGPLEGDTVEILRASPDSSPPRVRFLPHALEGTSVLLRWTVASYWGERNPDKIPTRHRIDGGEWAAWSTKRERTVSGLPFGGHVFEVQAKNILGRVGGPLRAHPFEVSGPFHRHPLFRFSVAGLFVLMGAAGTTIVLQRRREHRRVEESESRFRQLAENVHEVFWLIDTRANEVLYVSPTVEQVWGLPAADLLGSVAGRLEAVHVEDRARIRDAFEQAHAGGYDETCRIQRPDGSVRWVRDRTFPIRDKSGVVYRIAGISEDITVAKEAALALESSEERYRSLVEAVPDGILIHRDGLFVFSNPSGAELLGAGSPQEVVGRTVREVIHPDSRGQTEARFRAIDSSLLPVSRFEARFRRYDGGTLDVEVSGMPVLFDSLPAIQILVRDISERKRDEERQSLLMRELDHRVKNNLAGILAIAEQTVARARDLDEFGESFTARVRAMARTHEALASARWLGVPLAEIVRLMTYPFDTEGERIQSAGPDLMVRAIATSPLSIALHEFGTNAVKHGALGHVDGTVSIVWELDADGLHIVWAETGPAAEPTCEGVGLGLVRGVVEYELGGSAQFDFGPSGLVVRLDFGETSILEAQLGTADDRQVPV